jgi:hypothetical protein
MATFFDVALLSKFSIIFTFLLVFAIVFALLEFLKIFGANKGLHAIIAFSVAMLMIFSKSAVQIVNMTVPWFMIFLIIAVFGLVGYKLFAGPDVDLSILHQTTGLRTFVIIIVSVVFIVALGVVFGQNIGPYLEGRSNTTGTTGGEVIDGETASTATGSFTENLTATLFHPKVVGMLVILLIALFAVLFLSFKVEN